MEIKKQIFLENLPKWDIGSYKGSIKWIDSINCVVSFVYDDIEGTFKIMNYDKKKHIISVIYNDKMYNIGTSNVLNCKLGVIVGKITINFKVEIGTTFDDNDRNIIVTDREYRKDKNGRNWKYYKYTCSKCGWNEGWIEESNLLHHKKGCACCCDTPRVTVEGINDISTTAPWMIKYFKGGIDEAKLYTKSSNKKVWVICPDCGKIKNKPMIINDIYMNHSIGCTCSDSISYPNKFTYEFLNQLNSKYNLKYLEHEYSPNWIGRKRYDNYFIYKGKEYILEIDGGWHTQDNNISGQTAEESKAIDDYKDEQARLHNIKVIRINCEISNLDYMKQNILKDEVLNDLFDLSNIDWLKCEEFALSNLVKIACEYKNNNPEMTTTEIGNMMKLNKATVRRYLTQGSKLGWCQYNGELEKKKSAFKIGTASGKPVEIFKDEISLGVFPSSAELERQSEKLFGIKLSLGNISAICNGKRNYHKGFTFKFVNKENLEVAN